MAADGQRRACAVLGGGVVGLASAMELLDRGWQVYVVAEEVGGSHGVPVSAASPLTGIVSSGAGAVWEYPPFRVEPNVVAKRWTLATLPRLMELAADSRTTGVWVRRTHRVWRSRSAEKRREDAEEVVGFLPEFQEAEPPRAEVEVGPKYNYSYSFSGPVAWMPRYLCYLHNAVLQRGGTIHSGPQCVLNDLGEVSALLDAVLGRDVAAGVSLVVNCLGLAAHKVVPDPAVHPVRGGLVYVYCPEVTEVFFDQDDPDGKTTYVIPQGDLGVVACGGLAQPGRWEKELEPHEAAGILERCRQMVPALATAPVVGQWVGLRPMRSAEAGGVRVELELAGRAGRPVVHNYGHGGAGVITAWGCAEDVARLAEQALCSHLVGAAPPAAPLVPSHL